MSYSINEYTSVIFDNTVTSIRCSVTGLTIPMDAQNTDYQRVLDAIIDQGADCFEGDIPQELLDAAEAKRLSNV
jgi:hypothetical protein